jgi:hypothetical protein
MIAVPRIFELPAAQYCTKLVHRKRHDFIGRPFGVSGSQPPTLIQQVMLLYDNSAMPVPETCRAPKISRSSYYAALQQWQRLSV